MVRLPIDALAPDMEAVARAADVILAGGIVAFPTDTLYGLAVDPRRPAAVDALYAIKGRQTYQPIALVATNSAQVERCVGRLPDLGRALAEKFWPGPLTLVIPARSELAAALHSASGCAAVRVPAHAIAMALAARVGFVVTSTSANRTGQPAPATADGVVASLGGAVDLVLDAGPAPGGPPSTVVDVSGTAAVLLRSGAVPWERVLESLHQS